MATVSNRSQQVAEASGGGFSAERTLEAIDELRGLLGHALEVDPEGEEAALECVARGEQVEPHWAAVWEAAKKVGAVACEEQLPEQLEAWEKGDAEQLVAIIGEDGLREELSSADEWAASIDAEGDAELREWLLSIRSKVSRMRSQLSRLAPMRSRARPRASRARRGRRTRVRSGSRGDPPDDPDEDPPDLGRAARGRLGLVRGRA
jgi:hypothetical protein